jgi:hypothetical protein
VQSRHNTHSKTLDTVVAKAIMSIISSLGGGPVEQGVWNGGLLSSWACFVALHKSPALTMLLCFTAGRIGNALSREERVRSYIKDKHGSVWLAFALQCC